MLTPGSVRTELNCWEPSGVEEVVSENIAQPAKQRGQKSKSSSCMKSVGVL